MNFLAAVAQESGSVFSQEFAERVTWTPVDGQATDIVGIVDVASELVELGENIQLDGVSAMVNIDTAVAPAAAIGDTVVARGVTYRVIGHEPDGTGRTVLMLAI